MKKVLSVFLAALMVVLCFASAFAADGTHNVNFSLPGAGVGEGAYSFVKCGGDGNYVEFVETAVEDPQNQGYVYYIEAEDRQGDPATEPGGEYYLYSDLLFDKDKAKFDNTRYMPVCYDATQSVADGEQVIFRVETNEVYDISSVVIEVNGEKLDPKPGGEYVVTVTGDVTIAVREDVLLRNHFTVGLTSGNGYSVKTLKDQNNRYAYYGDSFEFRVKVAKGYSATDMKVKAVATGNNLSEILGEDADMLNNLLDKSDPLICLGQDAEGCYLYKLDNVTADYKITVSGVREESKAGILAMLKRILRLILHAFGIDTDSIPFLSDIAGEPCVVTINDTLKSTIKYDVSVSADNSGSNGVYKVMKNEGLMITLTTKDPEHSVKITTDRSDVNPADVKPLTWTANFNRYTAETTWTATYFVSSISSDMTINIVSEN